MKGNILNQAKGFTLKLRSLQALDIAVEMHQK